MIRRFASEPKLVTVLREGYSWSQLGAVTVAIVGGLPRLTHRVPGSLVALVPTTALVAGFAIPVETIGDRFGAVPQGLPTPAIPYVDWATMRALFQPAMTIALLAAIESLLSAVVADGMLGTRHRSNTELVAQGVANVVSPIFGGIPATGAIARNQPRKVLESSGLLARIGPENVHHAVDAALERAREIAAS